MLGPAGKYAAAIVSLSGLQGLSGTVTGAVTIWLPKVAYRSIHALFLVL